MVEKAMEILKFWAKTTHDKDKYPNGYHPLICHLIDVAAVAQELWNKVLSTAMQNRITNAFGLADDVHAAGKLVAFVAGLHDLGKCSPPFTLRGHNEKSNEQTKNLLKLYENTNYYKKWAKPAKEAPHGYVTASTLPEILKDDFGFPLDFARDISKLIGGHHGIFPTSRNLNKLKYKDYRGDNHWTEARKKLTIALAEALGISKKIDFNNNPKLANAEIMIVAGLVSVADWIGSDAKFFPCKIKDIEKSDFDIDLKEYKQKSHEQSGKALKKHGWILNKPNGKEASRKNENITGGDRFKELFPFIAKRRPLQDMAIEISGELNEPGIVIIEAPTGEGKTEAAMFLADAWNFHLKQTGYYFALPTQATSNQMFERVNNFLSKSFLNEKIQNQLLHGHASLSAEFETLKKNYINYIKNINDDENSGDSHTPSVVAAEWFTYRKRGLLAPFGVGTVDQALLAVLQTKHVFVRLFGLAHKTIIVDEVHAYDAYMSTLLRHLLKWLASLKCPVILLSATLPKVSRDGFVRSYREGLGKTSEDLQNNLESTYPQISYAVGKKPKSKKLKTSKYNKRTIYLRKIDESFIEQLKAKLSREGNDEGGCVAIICNTVARAQELFTLLSHDPFFSGNDECDGLQKVDLLHSRFRFLDRDEIEKRTLIRFGKEDGREINRKVVRPKLSVLVSTQIIEQSLDLDFDLMITELAPIDLLVQRAGRLQRHKRKNRSKNFEHKPELWIMKPDINDKGIPDFGKSKYVYDEHILLRTWLKIKEFTSIETPNNIAKLIEYVYDKDEEFNDEKLNAFWDKTKREMNDKLKRKRRKAEGCLITYIDDEDFFENASLKLDEDNPDVHKSLQALTRDVELPDVPVIILKKSERSKVDLSSAPKKNVEEFLLKRETKISKWGLTEKIIENAELKQDNWKTSARLRHYRLLQLDENDKITIDAHTIKLDERLGICIKENREKE